MGALENAELIEKTLTRELHLTFDYVNMDKVMRLIKENDLNILSQKMELNCVFLLSVRKNKMEQVATLIEEMRCVKLKKVN